ncbi:Leucine-rich repeat (LRR) protein [Geosmithia morbida]|uniref:Leucine-rich repeat (LRR) protein n=1 Tax=Geosmithia morbida TaxID=1094350 RepID=A0A9P5D5U0_9HYPO|nr:Leucine-rich repeat (LRR) protein [Geosmithia morbida]KAF4122839.1 Leucine-rich repeat (LRR) protein [Geosmithia morbida]
MASEEPSLPHLPAVSWDEHTQSFSNNPKKRGRTSRRPSPFTGNSGNGINSNNSSDPAVFSSDDDPALDNYVEGRRKKRYVGSWFQQHPTASSSDSAFGGDHEQQPLPHQPKGANRRTLARKLDSGVFLGSDGSDNSSSGDDFVLPEFEMNVATRSKVPQLTVAAARKTRRRQLSEPERQLQEKIRESLDTANETVDFWSMDLAELSGDTVSLLSQFEYIPQVTRDVAFEQRDPELELYLAQNRLTRLPGALFDVEHLAILSLRSNQLEELPPAISRLKNLQELNLSQNRLRHLPVELLDLLGADSKLRTLILHPNPFLHPNQGHDIFEILEDGGPAVYDNYDLDMEHEPNTEFTYPLAVPDDRLPRLMTRRLGRSPLQVSDAGGRVQSTFRLPGVSSSAEPVEVEVIFKRRLLSYGGVPSAQETPPLAKRDGGDGKVPSLVEAAMRSCVKSVHLPDLRDMVPPEFTDLGQLFDRALRQKEMGGLVCSRCRRDVVVPVLEWIEWREVSTLSKFRKISGKYRLDPLSERKDELVVPFLHRACSWACGPREESSGWEFPSGCEGMTVGYCLYNGPPESEGQANRAT